MPIWAATGGGWWTVPGCLELVDGARFFKVILIVGRSRGGTGCVRFGSAGIGDPIGAASGFEVVWWSRSVVAELDGLVFGVIGHGQSRAHEHPEQPGACQIYRHE